MRLALSRIHYPVSTLGPGARIGIWFQGCSIRCPGCISLDTWAPNRGGTTVGEVVDAIAPYLCDADGITISGGEPFDQPEALRELLKRIRDRHRGDLLVYSGFPLEELTDLLSTFNGLIDGLITDPFRADQPQTHALRGSDNQRLFCLTEMGRARFETYDRPLRPEERTLDVMFDDETGAVFMAGIPRPGDMRKLTEYLAALGHAASSSEDKHQTL